MTLFLLDHRIYWLAGFGGRKGDKSDLARTDRYSHTSLDIAYVTPCMLFLHVSPSVDLHYLYNPAHDPEYCTRSWLAAHPPHPPPGGPTAVFLPDASVHRSLPPFQLLKPPPGFEISLRRRRLSSCRAEVMWKVSMTTHAEIGFIETRWCLFRRVASLSIRFRKTKCVYQVSSPKGAHPFRRQPIKCSHKSILST